jgi:ABC-2 type transport system permease protein
VKDGVAKPVSAPRPSRSGAQLWALFNRELGAYFMSPMSYLVWAVFLFASGYLFATGVRDGGAASLAPTFTSTAMLLLFVAPMLTMRLVAEELKTGTLEILLTDPVGDAIVILGKYAAAVVFFAAMLTPTLAYPLVLLAIGEPDPGPVLAGYLGLALMGALFLAIGIMTSAVASNQIAAAALSFTLLLLFWALGRAADSVGPGGLRDVLDYVSVFSRYAAFRRGLVDTRSLVYFVSVAAFALLLAIRALGLRRLE